ncbi:hypothetical protein L6164_014149 [Bauhinia variegata]|uniref:Uncharacterized protein n=1 Tax=Bauhinia variegata TaxID=167791 RepID=A0ACB9NGY4_BAUVA|nr:hypothetical protein L6164_014149 [Bauhinia variegata]
MLVTGRSSILTSLTPYLSAKKNGTSFAKTLAKKRDSQESIKTPHQSFLPLRVSKSTLARAAIAVFGLGFIDAGYSGDWSRIGVITPESEQLLKLAAFLVVPFCVFLIITFPSESKS